MTREEVASFKSELDQLASARIDTLFQGTPRPRVLYHYTTAEGLLGIITSSRLHATNTHYLNDTSEVAYAAEMVRTITRLHSEQCSGYIKDLLDRIVAHGVDDIEWTVGRYVSCFCEDGDLLSQWRGYGAKGGGYSIGIEAPDTFHRFRRHSGATYSLRKIEYDPERQRQVISDAVTWICAVYGEMLRKYGDENAQTMILPFCYAKFRGQVFELLSCFKDPAFQEEQEWRLLAIIDAHDDVGLVKCRAKNGLIIPYIELDVTDSAGVHHGRIPVDEVVCGPATHPELAERSVRLFLERAGYSWTHTRVRRSKVPLSHYL
jgi:hypothetical protein